MGDLDKDLKKLLNKRVVGIDPEMGILYFENGLSIDYHVYETYLDRFDPRKQRKPEYYSRSFWHRGEGDEVKSCDHKYDHLDTKTKVKSIHRTESEYPPDWY